MSRIVIGIVAVTACLILGGKLADALTCNKCGTGILGTCPKGGTETCTPPMTTCYTGEISSQNIPALPTLSKGGCRLATGCNATSEGEFLGATFNIKIKCCATDMCNGAASAQLSLAAAASAALVACVWSSLQY